MTNDKFCYNEYVPVKSSLLLAHWNLLVRAIQLNVKISALKTGLRYLIWDKSTTF